MPKLLESNSLWKNPRIQNRIRDLDGLRGVAILMVVSFHYIGSIGAPRFQFWGFVTESIGLFQSGVDLFFVLSGFLISGILVDSRGSKHFFRTFYARRVYRIFPLYFGWLALYCLGLIFEVDRRWDLHVFTIEKSAPLWLYFVFLQNNAGIWFGALSPVWIGISWSLAIEEQFYALLPTVVRFCSRVTLGYAAAGVVLLSPFLRRLLQQRYAWEFASLSRLDALAIGVGIALLVRNEAAWQVIQRNRRTITLAAGSLFVVLVVNSYGGPAARLDRFTMVSVFYGLIVLIAVSYSDLWFCSILRTPVLLYFGRISYAAYLFHQGVRGIVGGLIPAFSPNTLRVVLVVTCSFAVTILLADFSWRFIERKLIARAHNAYRY